MQLLNKAIEWFTLGLLTPFLITTLPAAAVAVDVRTVAILTVRLDNIRSRTTAELIPVARYSDSRLHGIDSEQQGDDPTCSSVASVSPLRPGETFDVYFQGKLVGRIVGRDYTLAAYDCSGLCVMATEVDFSVPEGTRKDTRLGFDPSGDFDETLLQLVALSPSTAAPVFETSVPEKPSSRTRGVLAQLSESHLRTGSETQTLAQVEDIRLFRRTAHGEIHAFITASREDQSYEIAVLSAIVRLEEESNGELLFSLLAKGDKDSGAAAYEFLDAIDLDGDGVAEVVAVYHNYEFHEFVILALKGGRYEVVHRGPSYGC